MNEITVMRTYIAEFMAVLDSVPKWAHCSIGALCGVCIYYILMFALSTFWSVVLLGGFFLAIQTSSVKKEQLPTRSEEDGCIIYRDSNGRYHRRDGPAFISPDGNEEFWIHGELVVK